jgi:hypothetical protein
VGFQKIIYFIYLMYMSILQLSSDTPEDPITDGSEPPCSCWDLNSGPLEEQSVLLTTEPSLQPNNGFFFFICAFLRQGLITNFFRGNGKERIWGSGPV